MKIKDFYKTLFAIALPITLQNMLQTFINMLDTIMIGKLGAVEIAAVGLGNQVFFVLNMILFGITSGGSVFIAQYWGKKDTHGIKRSLGIMLFLSTLVAVVFTAGGLLIPERIISLYSPDREVIKVGAEYLQIVCFSYILFAITSAFVLAFRSTEHVKLPLFTTACSLVINLVFNYLFIFVFGWGVKGAALATVISRAVEFFIIIFVSYRKKYEACGKFKEYAAFDKSFVARFIKIAFPVIVNETLWGLGISIQNGIFAHAGTDAITAFNITGTISQLTWVFFIGLGNGLGVIIGKFIGAGEKEKAVQYAKRSLWFMPLMGALIGSLLFPLSKLLPFFFNVSPEIIFDASQMLFVLMLCYPFNASNMNWIVGICRSGGDTIFAALAEILCLYLISLPFGSCAAFLWKLSPALIYACLQSEQIVKTFTGLCRILSGKWLHDVTKK